MPMAGTLEALGVDLTTARRSRPTCRPTAMASAANLFEVFRRNVGPATEGAGVVV